MCYIRYRICNAQIKARVKYKVCQYYMLKNDENDKKKKNILPKCLRKRLFCYSKIHILTFLNHSMLVK